MVNVKYCDRVDVIKLLEPMLLDYWEGDSHTNGIYFTESHAYCINKILAIKVEHGNPARPLFYKVNEKSLERICMDYPYHNMVKKLQKRELIYDKENLEINEIDQFFLTGEGGIKIPLSFQSITSHIQWMEKNIKNKRERQRTICSIDANKKELLVVIQKKSKKARLIISEKMSKVNIATEFKVAVNTNTLYHALKICSTLSSVIMMYTGKHLILDGLYEYEDKTSKVRIVVALQKV